MDKVRSTSSIKKHTALSSLFNASCLYLSFYDFDLISRPDHKRYFKWSLTVWVRNIWYWFKAFVVLTFLKKRVHNKYGWEVFPNRSYGDMIEISGYNYKYRLDDPGYDWTQLDIYKGIFVGWSAFIYENGV